MRYPGRQLRPGELIPDKALRFVAAQLAVPPDALVDCAACGPTHRPRAANIVAGAIMLWNTTYLQTALAALAKSGHPVPGEHLAHLPPLGWQHISLTGD